MWQVLPSIELRGVAGFAPRMMTLPNSAKAWAGMWRAQLTPHGQRRETFYGAAGLAGSSLMESQSHLLDFVDKRYITDEARLEVNELAETALEEVTGLMDYLQSREALRNARRARERRIASRPERRRENKERRTRTKPPRTTNRTKNGTQNREPNGETEHEPRTENPEG
jgi:hypothetical protein